MAEALDIEKLVGEMEIAVDRLRSLYEQYFMGIEKLEPTVPRKDLDRRIQVLRKEQIRNTAQRFRFQMILQRYNTYQTHWQRICREIENGTYKRHVMRAQQRFGGEAPAPRRRDSVQPPPPHVLSRDLAAELAELDREFAPEAELDDLDLELVEDPPPRAPAQSPRAPAPSPPPARPSQPGPVWRKAAPPTAAPPAVHPLQHPSVPPARPAASAPRHAPPPAAAGRPPAAPSTAAPAPAPAARPAVPHPPTAAPPPRAPMASSPVLPRPAPTAAPAPPAPAPRPGAPAPSAPAAVPRPAAPSRGPGDLPEERVRQIYAQYVDAKRKQNESTAAITYEAVAKSLRDSSAKLREKHGKAVDFEVAVKDGKTILKPVIK